jgi:hypothetical protein
MSRQPQETVSVTLRIRERLRARLEHEAQRHRFSLNNEIRIRLEDSFERRDAVRSLSDVVDDLQINWARFSARFLRLDLEQQLAEAITQTNDLEKIRTLARLWLRHREQERPLPEGQPRPRPEGGVS